MAKITILASDSVYEVEAPLGSSIIDVAGQVGVVIETPCNGSGTCGKCEIQIVEAKTKEVRVVQACHTDITGDMTVRVPRRRDTENVQILESGQEVAGALEGDIYKRYEVQQDITHVFLGDRYIGFESGNTENIQYGVVVDIGTTTLVAALVDVTTGKEVAVTSALNPQSQYAQDVLSRIHYASSASGLDTLHNALISKLNEMIETLTKQAKVLTDHIYEVVFSGNTCMLHLAVHMNPASLGKYPYTSQITGHNYIKARPLGLAVSSLGEVYVPPVISSYVGADITAGIAAAGLDFPAEITLFIDIGTNGEMILAGPDKIAATSTAAGPAFEGMNIACGMRAAPGAIESFQITEAGIKQQTIGGFSPIGICGSGLIDIVGELVRVGVILPNGKFADEGLSEQISKHLVERAGKKVFDLGRGVYVTQKDIRQVQLAKGAIRSGIEALLQNQKIGYGDVAEVQIAGSFGYHLRPESLVSLGLLPPEFVDKIVFLGNTAKTGGQAFLTNIPVRKRIAELVEKIDVVELSTVAGFDKLFVQSLHF